MTAIFQRVADGEMAVFQVMLNGLMRAARKVLSRRWRKIPTVTREAYVGTLTHRWYNRVLASVLWGGSLILYHFALTYRRGFVFYKGGEKMEDGWWSTTINKNTVYKTNSFFKEIYYEKSYSYRRSSNRSSSSAFNHSQHQGLWGK